MQEAASTPFPWEHPPVLLRSLVDGLVFTGVLARDVPAFLRRHGHPYTAEHSAQVAAEARRVAQLVGAEPALAEMAGWLHDCSAVFPARERVVVARSLNVPVLAEEEQFSMIVHQKLSKVLAAQIFGVRDTQVLSAVACHTTLKAHATRLDKVVFVADKIAWDQPGIPPYRAELLAALEQSLDQAAYVYLRYVWEQRQTLKVVHPWLREAYRELSQSCV